MGSIVDFGRSEKRELEQPAGSICILSSSLDPLDVTPYIALRLIEADSSESTILILGRWGKDVPVDDDGDTLEKMFQGFEPCRCPMCHGFFGSMSYRPRHPDGEVESDFEPNFPRTMSWSAYNLGTTGYNQAVGIGKALKDNYGVNLRVLPGKNDVSRLLPLQRGRVQFSANGVATYFGQEGVFQFAGKTWGPMPLRIVLASHGDSNQALGVANDLRHQDLC